MKILLWGFVVVFPVGLRPGSIHRESDGISSREACISSPVGVYHPPKAVFFRDDSMPPYGGFHADFVGFHTRLRLDCLLSQASPVHLFEKRWSQKLLGRLFLGANIAINGVEV